MRLLEVSVPEGEASILSAALTLAHALTYVHMWPSVTYIAWLDELVCTGLNSVPLFGRKG